MNMKAKNGTSGVENEIGLQVSEGEGQERDFRFGRIAVGGPALRVILSDQTYHRRISDPER